MLRRECVSLLIWLALLQIAKSDDCSNSPCGNNATCIVINGSYSCNCASGWTGINCTEAKCNSGFFRNTSGICQSCPIGTYQPSEEQTTCISCTSGTTTIQIASTLQTQCIAKCSSGFFRSTSGICQSCPIGTYQPSEEQTTCISCTSGTTTIQIASTMQTQCIAKCSSGFFRNTSGICQSCPIGTYQPSEEQTTCISCTSGTTTIQIASTLQTQCIAKCDSGFFRNTSGICQSCPIGTYQPSKEETTCISCTRGTTTIQVASTLQTQCIDIDECTFSPCGNNATCINTNGSYVCNCASGWSGINCVDDIDECSSMPCGSNQICINTNGSYICNCASGWKGLNCSEDINECSDLICGNNATCINTNGAYLCNCTNGWMGNNCTEDIDECKIAKCRNNATCQNSLGSYICTCTAGWMGYDCTEGVYFYRLVK